MNKLALAALAALWACPALCLAAVDTTSTAYRNGRLAGIAFGVLVLVVVLQRLTGLSWIKSLAIGAVACGAWFGLRGTAAKATGLDQQRVEAFVMAGAQASSQRNAAALCNQYADDAKIRLVTVRFSGSEVANYDKAQWCDYLRQGYAALPAGVSIDTHVNVLSFDLADDGQQADVSLEVTETVRMGGRGASASSTQQATIQLVNGEPRYTAASARMTAGQ
ncbi:hypothetical protein [Ideonella sp.]|uniref:hypothetical protein n=1 Tax=Ideonella sp. TaxID=1929293 RepID=UPI0035ADBD42